MTEGNRLNAACTAVEPARWSPRPLALAPDAWRACRQAVSTSVQWSTHAAVGPQIGRCGLPCQPSVGCTRAGVQSRPTWRASGWVSRGGSLVAVKTIIMKTSETKPALQDRFTWQIVFLFYGGFSRAGLTLSH